MVVGASGLGRTTFVNTLCERSILAYRPDNQPFADGEMQIVQHQVDLEEEGVKISLTIVDTPGFGDSINNEFCFKQLVEYVERQYDDILAEESRIKRNPKFKDNRIHALLYFLTPTGHGLRELDIEFMRRLSPRVNVIPVIGKADSFTLRELTDFKHLVMQDIDHYNIPVYNFPVDVEEDDEDTIEENNELRGLMPFAIVSSEEDAGETRVRRYPWGDVEVDNSDHSDFGKLRYALMTSHLNDLKEITHDFLYENYRTEKLSKENRDDEEDEEGEEGEDERDDMQVRIKEDHLRMEEQRLKENEVRVKREITEKRHELMAKEDALRTLESRLTA
jgi:cell division control protein 11